MKSNKDLGYGLLGFTISMAIAAAGIGPAADARRMSDVMVSSTAQKN